MLIGLWLGLLIWFAGRLLDARWHATHSEFEGAVEQVEAHWLAWLGVLLTLAIAVEGGRRFPALRRRAGLRILIAGGLLYFGVGIWHFIEHANGTDPGLAHVFLVIGNAGMLLGVILLTLQERRGSPAHATTKLS